MFDQPLTRRQLLTAAAVGAAPVLRTGRTSASLRPRIHPRSDWARGLPPKAAMAVERPGDVRFLLVHHTETSNRYRSAAVPELLRGFYRFHTGPEKRWPDVAYNFFVDKYGGIWEARQGSLTSPVMGSATGGSQGHAILCCFVGNHATTPPTAAAQAAMVSLLAWLGDEYDIDTRPGTTTTFISRGSSKWPRGSRVTTSTIATHRQMSQPTTCPGDAAARLVLTSFPTRVTQLRAASR